MAVPLSMRPFQLIFRLGADDLETMVATFFETPFGQILATIPPFFC